MRALYDPFPHESGRHFGSEVWVSFELGQLDRYPHHHSYLIIDLPRFGIFRMSGSSSSLIATLVSHLFSLLSSTSLFIFFYPHRSSSRFMNVVSFGVHHLLLSIVHSFVGRVTLLIDSLTFGIAHTGVWHYLLVIWAFIFYHFIHLSPLACITVRVARPP